MTQSALAVAENLVVSLEYTLKLDDGEEIDSSDGQDPLEFLQGHGQIVSGLEQALYGLKVGEERDVSVAPTEGYGEYDPDDFETVSRDTFPQDLELTVGMGLYLRDQESGKVYETYVAELPPEEVVLDLNHPLAGETLLFHVKVVGLRDATSEELSHGHVHGSNDGH
jgi:FKBP-type peptidyl-prolyl cis-trans isomerase SlyD